MSVTLTDEQAAKLRTILEHAERRLPEQAGDRLDIIQLRDEIFGEPPSPTDKLTMFLDRIASGNFYEDPQSSSHLAEARAAIQQLHKGDTRRE